MGKVDGLPEINVAEIFTALRKTPAAKPLRSMLRFGPFRHETESPQHWKKVLGPSANSFTHMPYVYKFLRKMIATELQISPNFFTKEEQKTLLLAAACHDFGEAVINGQGVGDIIIIWKKPYHEEQEHKVFDEVLAMLKLPKKLKGEISTAYNIVMREKTNRLGHYFNAIEKTEYLDTILKVYRNHLAENRIKNRQLLIGQVLTTYIPPLIEHTEQYVSIKKYLGKNRHFISSAFKYTYRDYVNHDPTDKRYVKGIETSLQKWTEFSSALR